MSEDEVVVTVIGVLLGPLLWGVVLFRLWQVANEQRKSAPYFSVLIALVVATGIIFTVLSTVASFDVVHALSYKLMYTCLGLAWLRCVAALFSFAGISLRDDVVERGNDAAAVAWTGALIGVTCCYAGANVGDGPGWTVVMFCAMLSTGTLLIAWLALAQISPVTDSVTIDRDRAAGLRSGAFLIACGMILGRGVAGDWVSDSSTFTDFSRYVPVVIGLVAVAALVERVARPTAQQPRPSLMWGVLPSILYFAVAVAILVMNGAPA